MSDWILPSWTALGAVLLAAIATYLALILLTRLGGLRSYSKISSFDFAITVAMGSLVATTIVAEDPALLQGLWGLALLFGFKIGLARLRTALPFLRKLVDNDPVLLMDGPTILDRNLERCQMTRAELMAKLREANVLRLEQVRAVVMESTGDVSVLHSEDPEPIDDEILEHVER